MAEFQVTASELSAKAEELVGLNNEYWKGVEDLIAAHSRLNGMWEGAAKQAFDNAFISDQGKMNAFYQAIVDFSNKLNTIAAEYQRAESANVQIAAERR